MRNFFNFILRLIFQTLHTMAHFPPGQHWMQAQLARGPREVAAVLEESVLFYPDIYWTLPAFRANLLHVTSPRSRVTRNAYPFMALSTTSQDVVINFPLTAALFYPPLVLIWPIGYHTAQRRNEFTFLLQILYHHDEATYTSRTTFINLVHYNLAGLSQESLITILSYALGNSLPLIVVMAG
jgi:hypothetical protein